MFTYMPLYRPGTTNVAEYNHNLRHCSHYFLDNGSKIHAFRKGLNPGVENLVMLAPVGHKCSVNGKWNVAHDPKGYAVLYSSALAYGGALDDGLVASSVLLTPTSTHNNKHKQQSKKLK